MAEQAKQIVRDLEDMGSSLSAIAREHECTPQFVSRAIRCAEIIGSQKAEAIRSCIAAKLGRNPWADGASPAA